jgi:hypothetical protein
LTTLYVRRKEVALGLLDRQKVLLQNDLRHQLGAEEGGAPLDLKTVRRLVKCLISEGLAAQLEVAVPVLRGSPRMHVALMHPSLTHEHPLVQNFIARVCAAEPKLPAQRVKPEVATLPELHIEVPSVSQQSRVLLLPQYFSLSSVYTIS